jgi:hypothetical protein
VNRPSRILHIIPRTLGSANAVRDYAQTLVVRMADLGYAGNISAEFEALPIDVGDHAVLHYVNYGYHKRGIPLRLVSLLRKFRGKLPGKLGTVFHEVYASSSPAHSAFWLQPLQRRVAAKIAKLSDFCIATNEVALAQLKQLAPDVAVRAYPVFSNFGEPFLTETQLNDRTLHRWVIAGGTAAVEKSLRSFAQYRHRIPQYAFARELFILGGSDNPRVRSIVADFDDCRVSYRPRVTAREASEVLSGCTFAWLDYFHRCDVPASIILKSSVFGACCAHGVIPVFSHRAEPILFDGRVLPGPYYLCESGARLPAGIERGQIALAFYRWYQDCARSEHVARAISVLLQE